MLLDVVVDVELDVVVGDVVVDVVLELVDGVTVDVTVSVLVSVLVDVGMVYVAVLQFDVELPEMVYTAVVSTPRTWSGTLTVAQATFVPMVGSPATASATPAMAAASIRTDATTASSRVLMRRSTLPRAAVA